MNEIMNVDTTRMLTLKEQFSNRRAVLVKQLQEVDDALAMLEKHPDFADFITAVKTALKQTETPY